MLPGGYRGVTIRALHRAELGRADAAGRRLRIEVIERPDPTTSRASQELRARVPRHHRGDPRGARQPAASPRSCARSTPPARWPTRPATRPTSRSTASSSCSRRSTSSERLEKAIGWAKEALGEIELRRRIRDDVTEGMEKQQREFLLRRQMDAIRKELGERTTATTSRGTARASPRRRSPTRRARRPSASSTGSQPPAATAPRGRRSAPTSTRCSPCRGASTPRRCSTCNAARETLDADHAGLEEVKARILEYLAVRKFRRERDIYDERSRRDPRAGRASRCRQDLARRVDRQAPWGASSSA